MRERADVRCRDSADRIYGAGRILMRGPDPQPGYFKFKVVRGGAHAAAHILRLCRCTATGGDDSTPHEWCPSCDRYPPLTVLINGRERRFYVERVWLYGDQISRDEYNRICAVVEWDERHDPFSPTANPHERIDLGKMKPLF